MKFLMDVFSNYHDMKIEQKNKTSKSIDTPYPSIKSIMLDIPEMIRDYLIGVKRGDEFKITGSFGQGNVAEIPWVCVFNKEVTTSASKGYYIVLLFSADMTSCYLSLNQAVTEYKNRYDTKNALYKMSKVAELANEYIGLIDERAVVGNIDLKAKGSLGVGYEKGAIVSYKYSINNLTNDEDFISDLALLIKHYDKLIAICGDSLFSINITSDGAFQRSSFELAGEGGGKLIAPEVGGVLVPPKKRIGGRDIYKRDERISAKAILKSNFKCEYDNEHQTFKSSANGHDYVEAHHLIPISFQENFKYSIDIQENIIALCPNCHRLLHHGYMEEKRPLLEKLFVQRENLLASREISITLDCLYELYTKNRYLDE